MPDIKDLIRDKLSKAEEDPTENAEIARFGWGNPAYADLLIPARSVMITYQNANRWLDTLKEQILIQKKCPYFSNIVHQLAHTMPVRFDQFGDILHSDNLEVPYPGTGEWTNEAGDMKSMIGYIYDILGSIRSALYDFKAVAESKGMIHLSIACDPLVSDISNDFEFYYRIEDLLDYYGENLAQWDKYVYNYWVNKANLV